MLALVDSNNLAWIAHHSTGELSYDEKRVGVIYGFLRQLYMLSKNLKTNQFVFLFDSQKNYRKIIYPKYKQKRREKLTSDELFERKLCQEQINQLRTEILPNLGFNNVYSVIGYEADDLIAHVALSEKTNKIIISSDEDLYQLLDSVNYIYKSKSKRKYDKKTFVNEYGLDTCSKWIDVKAIAGCSSDCIEGIAGVGEKTAIKYINNQLKQSKALDKIKAGCDIIKRNRLLVELPFKGPKKLKLNIKTDQPKKKDFLEVFDSLRFNSFIKKQVFEQWTERFDLE